MVFNRNYNRKKYVAGGFQNIDSDDEPEETFESVFLKTYWSYITERKLCSRLEYDPNYCSSSLDSLSSCLNMMIPYIYKEGDLYPDGHQRPIDKIIVRTKDGTKEEVLVNYIVERLNYLQGNVYKLYCIGKKERIAFMHIMDFLFAQIPRYFKRMGLGLTELVVADFRYSRDDPK